MNTQWMHVPTRVLFEYRGRFRLTDGCYIAGYRWDTESWDYWPEHECAATTWKLAWGAVVPEAVARRAANEALYAVRETKRGEQ